MDITNNNTDGRGRNRAGTDPSARQCAVQEKSKGQGSKKHHHGPRYNEEHVSELLNSNDPKKILMGLQRIQLPEYELLYSRVVDIALEPPDKDTGFLAKKRIRYIKDHAITRLLHYVDEGNKGQRIRAIQLLGFLREGSAVPALLKRGEPDTDHELGVLLITYGALKNPASLPFVVAHLDHPDPKIRVQAVTAAGGFYGEEVPKELLGKLKDSSSKVRLATIFALERYQDSSIASELKKRLKDPKDRIRAEVKRVLEKCEKWIQEAPLIEVRNREEKAILELVPDVEDILARMKDDSVDLEPVVDVIPLEDYLKELAKHTSQFRVEFERYFRKHKEPISSFDTECFYGHPVLYMGLTMRSPTDIEAFGAVTPSLYGVKYAGRNLQNHLLEKLRTINTIVTAHGFNNVERQMMYKSGVDFYDTNRIVKLMRRTDKDNFRQMLTTGLGKFEKAVHFKRNACHFWKHKISEDALLAQMVHSLREGLDGKNYRECLICEEPQDHFLYCLEDAFVSLLIYIYVKNRFDIQPRGRNQGRKRHHARKLKK